MFCAQASAREWQRDNLPAAIASLISSTARPGIWSRGLDAVVGEQGVHLAGLGKDEVPEESGNDLGCGLFNQLDSGALKLAHRHQQITPSLLRTDPGDVDVEVADRVALKTRAL